MSKKSLLKADKYFTITFPTTHNALHAEKVLDECGVSFLVVPTPREISAGCGLSIRFFEDSLFLILEKFHSGGIVFSNLYNVENGQFKKVPPNLKG